MVVFSNHSFNFYLTKTLWILFIIFHQINLVICDDSEEDNLKKALEAIEHRQRDLELQESEYYGQPENIGYGFQKTFGFFDNNRLPIDTRGYDFNRKNQNELQNILHSYQREGQAEKRKSNFRERMTNDRINYLVNGGTGQEEYEQADMEYFKMLKNLLSKYRQPKNEDLSLEDLSDEDLENILNPLYEKDGEEEEVGNDYRMTEIIPMKSSKNYRVFEGLRDKSKRPYQSFKQRKVYRPSHYGYENPTEIDFSNFGKFTNTEASQEDLTSSRDVGYEDLADDKDIIRTLFGVANAPKYIEEEELYWPKDQGSYDDEMWLQNPLSSSDEWYDISGRNEKRTELAPKHFKAHNGIHLNEKRFPVKRSSSGMRKDVENEKAPKKELKNIFESSMTAVPPKKKKKATNKAVTKSFPAKEPQANATKPAVTKHREDKKVVRSVDESLAKEKVLPIRQNKEIADLFKENQKFISKKSIDWSQYFGIDKRGKTKNWINNDYLSRSGSHFLPPKSKRLSSGDDVYNMPFDTRRFGKKNYEKGNDVRASIDKVETKIGDIEEKIIDDALKYTGAHSGTNEDDFSGVQKKVIQHLEAAFSLEKMKNALEEFKNLIRPETEKPEPRFFETSKKGVTEMPNLPHLPPPPPPPPPPPLLPQTTSSSLNKIAQSKRPVDEETSGIDEPKVEKTKKEEDKDAINRDSQNLEFLNAVSYPSRNYDGGECPIVDHFQRICLRIEEYGGKYAESLVPLCSLQQICYFCGHEIGFFKTFMCDSMYLMEARNLCRGDGECLINAKSNLLALRDLFEQDFMIKNNRRPFSGSCLANPCLKKYFINSPGAMYSLENQD